MRIDGTLTGIYGARMVNDNDFCFCIISNTTFEPSVHAVQAHATIINTVQTHYSTVAKHGTMELLVTAKYACHLHKFALKLDPDSQAVGQCLLPMTHRWQASAYYP